MNVAPTIRTEWLDDDADERWAAGTAGAEDRVAALRAAHVELCARMAHLRSRRVALDSALVAATDRGERAPCWQVAVRRQARSSAASVRVDLAAVDAELDELAVRVDALRVRIGGTADRSCPGAQPRTQPS